MKESEENRKEKIGEKNKWKGSEIKIERKIYEEIWNKRI